MKNTKTTEFQMYNKPVVLIGSTIYWIDKATGELTPFRTITAKEYGNLTKGQTKLNTVHREAKKQCSDFSLLNKHFNEIEIERSPEAGLFDYLENNEDDEQIY